MEKTIKQILEIDHQGMAKFLILEICPNMKNKILYKNQSLIFHPIIDNFKPTNTELVQFNDFLVNEISRAKKIIPTFKNYFDQEINLIIPNELQTTSSGIKELKLEQASNGRYWINDNLLKGFKEEILASLKLEFKNETITNFNFTELIIGNQVFKIKNRIKDLEIGVSHLDVKYRLTKINKLSSDAIVKTINNLKLKVVYIWSEQDLLSYQISQNQIMANRVSDKIIVVDWHEHNSWITTDYLDLRKTFKVNIGLNTIYKKVKKSLNWSDHSLQAIKSYFTQTSLTDHDFDHLSCLKLKPSNDDKLNLFSLKELKVKLIQAYVQTLQDLRNELYYNQQVSDVDFYEFFHFGKINELKDFKSFINDVMSDNLAYLNKHVIVELNKQINLTGIYHSSYEHLFIFGEWMKSRMEKSLLERHSQNQIQSTFAIGTEQLLGNTYRPRAAYNKQKYVSFNEKTINIKEK